MTIARAQPSSARTDASRSRGRETFGALITGTNGWGDFAADPAGNGGTGVLLGLSGTTITRYNLADGLVTNTVTNPASANGIQGGGDILGNIYVVGTVVQQIDPVTGAAIPITTDGTTALGGVADAATWVPATVAVGDRVFADHDASGSVTAGDTGFADVTVRLVDDADGVVDAGERVLATDTTDAEGTYQFSGVLPGRYIRAGRRDASDLHALRRPGRHRHRHCNRDRDGHQRRARRWRRRRRDPGGAAAHFRSAPQRRRCRGDSLAVTAIDR